MVKRVKSDGTAAVGYLRVSTNEQGDSGLGLDAQRAAIVAECQRRGWSLGAVHEDVASGKSTKHRPALAAILDDLDSGRAHVLVVAKLDRLARSMVDFASLMERAQRKGWAVVALDCSVDTTTASGGLMVNVLAAFAEYERRLIADRTSAALQAKRARGARLGTPVKLPEATRQRIAELRAEGLTLAAIGDTLTREHVPTATGGKWWPATIRAVLRSIALDAEAAQLAQLA